MKYLAFLVKISLFKLFFSIQIEKIRVNFIKFNSIILIIPLFIRSIWYGLKYISEDIMEGMKQSYDIKTNKFEIIYFAVKPNTNIYNQLINETPESINDFLDAECNFCLRLHEIIIYDAIWTSYSLFIL